MSNLFSSFLSIEQASHIVSTKLLQFLTVPRLVQGIPPSPYFQVWLEEVQCVKLLDQALLTQPLWGGESSIRCGGLHNKDYNVPNVDALEVSNKSLVTYVSHLRA